MQELGTAGGFAKAFRTKWHLSTAQPLQFGEGLLGKECVISQKTKKSVTSCPAIDTYEQMPVVKTASGDFSNQNINHIKNIINMKIQTTTSTSTLTHKIRHSLFGMLSFGIALAITPLLLVGSEVPDTLDDFSHEQINKLGFPRMVMDDTATGGKSTFTQTITNGVLRLEGNLVPPRGQPAWVSLVELLSPDGSPVDISQYEGVRLKIRIEQGMVSLSVNSTDVVNFDYHAAMIEGGGKGMTEVRIPFKNMRRAWSEQTKLNTKAVASLSLVAVGLQPGSFAYEVEEIGFY